MIYENEQIPNLNHPLLQRSIPFNVQKELEEFYEKGKNHIDKQTFLNLLDFPINKPKIEDDILQINCLCLRFDSNFESGNLQKA